MIEYNMNQEASIFTFSCVGQTDINVFLSIIQAPT